MAVQKIEMAYDVYAEVVARWNARVEATPGKATMNEYFSYLMTVYDRLASVDVELGEARMERIRETWRTAPTPESTPEEVRDRPEEYPWLPYLDRAAAIVEEFYPWVPSSATERVLLLPPEDPVTPLPNDDVLEPDPSAVTRWP
jgi:hypothetical protein